MKRYLLFAGSEFYPNGGANDFIGSFNSIDLAISKFDEEKQDWANIFDIESEKIVKHYDYGWKEGRRYEED